MEEQFLETGSLGFRHLNALEFSADSRTLAIAGGDQTAVLDLVEQSRIRTVQAAHRDRIIGVIFSPAAPLAVSASRDGELFLWDIARMVVAGRAKAAPLGGCLSFRPSSGCVRCTSCWSMSSSGSTT